MTAPGHLRALSLRLDGVLDPATLSGPHLRRWIGPDHWWVASGPGDDALRWTIHPGSDDGSTTADRLASIEPTVGPPPIAVGTRPFDPTRSFDMVVPRICVRCTADGDTWITLVDPDDDDAAEPRRVLDRWSGSADAAGRDADELAPGYTVTASMPTPTWCASIIAATEAIRAGRADKVVLARQIEVTCTPPVEPSEIVARLHTAFPSCVSFHVDGLVGATPELLVRRAGDHVTSFPLAGTAPRSADPTADARMAASLLASSKDRAEHQITVDEVHDVLLPHCSWLDALAEPTVVSMANVVHLGTLVEGRLSQPAASALELMLELHPTPAVGGHPTPAALELRDELEGADRGRYAGTVGWVDAAGDGEWMVAIRCAELDPERPGTAIVWSGVGVVADSDPVAELAETRQKLRAILGALIQP